VTNDSHSESKDLGLFELCGWSLGYAIRRKWRMALVILTILFNTALEVIKPWPMVFLIDYVLSNKERPALLSHFLEGLPRGASTGNLIGWSVAATILIFLLGWAVELVVAYTNISWAQRMVYDLS